MSPAEIAWRVREQALRRAWSRRQVRPGQVAALPPLTRCCRGGAPVHVGAAGGRRRARARGGQGRDPRRRGPAAQGRVGDARRRPHRHGAARTGSTTRRRAAGLRPEAYAFRVDHRDEAAVGNIKQVWEVNRLQHLTLLAAAWYLTGEDAYAERVAEQLASWWRENPFLSGVNWTSGIELGVRLINFAWIRRLLDDWPAVADLFERNDLALRQIRWHQEYLAAFESRGSSANNHLIAEAAGQLAASCAFPWFAESARWRRDSRALLERELDRNTFPSGINRELASDYHGFVFELGVFAAVEAAAAGTPVSAATLAAAVRDGRRHGRAGRRAAAAAPPGRLRRGPRGAARRARAQPVAGAAVARRRALRPAGLVAAGARRRRQRAGRRSPG